jgi:predicted enzyme related to lactoylglutathione lyase
MKHHKINYLEMPAEDILATKAFFTKVFGWKFIDFGPEYTAFEAEGIDGGFVASTNSMSTESGSALVVLYSDDLEASLSAVELAGGEISTQIFSFPGGRRFHFIEPSGNEFAVWSE